MSNPIDLTKVWIKWPGPGELRGEGHWYRGDAMVFDTREYGSVEGVIAHLVETGYLPVHHGDSPPEDDPDNEHGTIPADDE